MKLSAVRRVALASMCVAHLGGAQQPAGIIHRNFDVGATPLIAAPSGQAPSTRDPGAFLLEAAGGSLGSLVGIGVVALTASCGSDDLECVIVHVGAGGALGAIGATIGTSLAARHTGGRRSVAGAALGSVAGIGIGLGIHYLLNHDSNRNLGDGVVVPIFVVSQGVLAAFGSRLLGTPR